MKNIIGSGFGGQVYPVNPNCTSIGNLPCFPDVKSLPEIPDLAVVAIPVNLVLETLNQIGERGIKNAVIFSAGFKETGKEGEKLQDELIEIAQKYQINVLGPNCLGFVNNLCPINVTFGELVNQPGNLRFISQSGAIAASLFDWCKSTGLGFSQFVTLGNKAVINENDVLGYFQNISVDTRSVLNQEVSSEVLPIGLYLESISDGPQFLKIARQISKTDPIFILKPGKTRAAAQAMQSHTGAIAGEDTILEAVLSQAGVIRAHTLEDFFDLSRGFAWENAPSGVKVAIISNAGGPAVISADAVVGEGLQLAEFDSQTKEQLMQILPRSASILNPVDVLGDALAERIGRAAEIILREDLSQSLIVILTPQVMTQIEKTAEFIGALSKRYRKPIFCSFIGGSLIAEGEQKLNELKIPSFRFPERAIATIGAMWQFKKWQEEQGGADLGQTLVVQVNFDQIQEIIGKAQANGQKILDNIEADQLIRSVGITTPDTSEVINLDQAEKLAQEYGFPVVLKLSSPGLLHKKEIGGVITDLRNINQLEVAWDKLQRKISQMEADIRDHAKIQIQKDIVEGVEVIVGVKHDSTFGPVLLFGAGGSLAQLIDDHNLHLLPLDIFQAKKLVEKSKVFSLLGGQNDEPSYALDKLYELIVRLGKLAETFPQVSDIEINPVIVTLNDVWAVDAKVILKNEESRPVALPKFKVARTVSNIILAGKYHYLDFETPDPFIFRPGQFLSVKVGPQRTNCYSIAGRGSDNHFNLLVDTSPGGPGSKFFENLKTDDKIAYLGPFGTFNLKLDDGGKHLLFLATGCGFAPLKSMIEEALNNNYQLPISLYLGFSLPEDVFLQDYLQKLSQKYPNFSYKIAVYQPNDDWKGNVGFITKLIQTDIPDASGYSAYLCGNKYMIADATKLLLSRNLPQERVYTEKY